MESKLWKPAPERPVLVDRFLDECHRGGCRLYLADGETSVVGAIMEHIEQAGVHSPETVRLCDPGLQPKQTRFRLRDH